jgi:hypothetical protein
MDELRLLAGDSTAHQGEGAPPGPRDASSRWRLELERAQWAVRTQRASATERPVPHAGGLQQAEQTRPRPVQGESGSQDSGRSRSATSSKAEVSPARQSAPAATRVDGATAKPAMAAALAQSRPQTGRSGALPPGPPPAPRPVPIPWPRVHVHAMANGDATDVWLRDAGLSDKQCSALAAELRLRMHAAGRRLGMLTVNGEQIFPPERTSPWQSKR